MKNIPDYFKEYPKNIPYSSSKSKNGLCVARTFDKKYYNFIICNWENDHFIETNPNKGYFQSLVNNVTHFAELLL